MNLTPRERDKLLVAMAAEVARKRLARGVKLNHPEAIALITDAVVEGARDGRSVADLLRRGVDASLREGIFAQATGNRDARAIRTQRYKLIRNFSPSRLAEMGPDHSSETCPTVQLFDLANDPNEFDNMAENSEYANVRHDLEKRLLTWMVAVDDPILQGPVKFPYYLQSRAECDTILNRDN